MACQVLDEGVEGAAQIGGLEGPQGSALEIEEGAGGVPTLGRPIGVKEDAFACGHCEGLHLRGGGKPEGSGAHLRIEQVDRPEPVAQRRRMAEVDDPDLVARELQQHGRDEVLVTHVAAHRLVHGGDDVYQKESSEGGVPESAECDRRQADTVETLAAHVADDDPEPMGRLDRIVEVAPDERLFGGGGVAQRLAKKSRARYALWGNDSVHRSAARAIEYRARGAGEPAPGGRGRAQIWPAGTGPGPRARAPGP